jgi:transposase
MDDNKFEVIWSIGKHIFDYNPEAKRLGGPLPTHSMKEILRAIYWIKDSGAQWKYLPKEFPPRSTVHYWHQKWSHEGHYDQLHMILVDLATGGSSIEDSYVDASFVRSKGASEEVGRTKCGKGSKLMALVDENEFPISLDVVSASPHESKVVERTLDMKAIEHSPKNVIGDKAYDNDPLDKRIKEERGINLIAPHKNNRVLPATQDQTILKEKYKKRHRVENFFAYFQWSRRVLIRYEKKVLNYLGFALFKASVIIIQKLGLFKSNQKVEVIG